MEKKDQWIFKQEILTNSPLSIPALWTLRKVKQIFRGSENLLKEIELSIIVQKTFIQSFFSSFNCEKNQFATLKPFSLIYKILILPLLNHFHWFIKFLPSRALSAVMGPIWKWGFSNSSIFQKLSEKGKCFDFFSDFVFILENKKNLRPHWPWKFVDPFFSFDA